MWLHCTKAVLADELKRSRYTRAPGTLVRRRRSRVWLTANERNEPRGTLLRVPIRRSGLHRFQCAQHVLDDIVGVLKPNRDPQQAVANTELGALRRRQPLVCRCRRMRDQTLGVTEIFGCPAIATASVAALSVCRRTRTASVSSPLSSTQALNGDIDGPVCRSSTWIFSMMNFCEPRIIPPRQRPWPSICLVAE